MAQQGQAGGYYNNQYEAPSGPPPSGYEGYQGQQGYQQSPPQQQFAYAGGPPLPSGQQLNHQTEEYGKPQYTQNPPEYGSGFVPPVDDKQTFQQTFKIEKPKWNDLWAAILLLLTFLGFVAVSGIACYRYSRYHKFNGGGIYGSANDFSLNTNTLVLFVFVLVVAFVLSWGYFLAARAFTKQFVWLTGILNCVFAVATAVYYLYRRLWGAGIVFAIFAIFAIICFM